MEKDYFRIHNWLAYHHGTANKCENELCKYVSPKRYEWALLKGKDHSRDRNNYIQLCPSCHRKYDITFDQRNKMSIARKGRPATNKRQVVLNNVESFESITEASLQTGVSVSSIHNNLKGLSKKTKKGTWNYKQVN